MEKGKQLELSICGLSLTATLDSQNHRALLRLAYELWGFKETTPSR